MSIGPRLDLRQSQNLVMTPQLQQAIKLLQFSNVELNEYVEGELEVNPLLERNEEREKSTDNGLENQQLGEDQNKSTQDDAKLQDSHDIFDSDNLPNTADAPLDTDYRNDYDGEIAGAGVIERNVDSQSLNISGSGGRTDFSNDRLNLEDTLSSEKNLKEYLIEQLQMDISDSGDRMIGLHLIDGLDDAGWFIHDCQNIADQLGCDLHNVENILAKMQKFEPAGIFARSLKECLAIQLEELNRLDPAMQILLDNLELLAARDVGKLLKKCKVDQEDLVDMVAEIRALNPKPASSFDHEITQPVIADVLMSRSTDDEWTVELNPETLPRVLVNEHYFTKVSKNIHNKEDSDYLSERLQMANWLVKSLHQRATTILKVSSELVRQQDGFFRHGIKYLRPLVLRDIADVIEMHESTVSRVTSNKYISTPRGLFELKYFFTSAISSTGAGDDYSAETVRHHIKTFIDNELPKKILSDDKIVSLLKNKGIDIARRTVAKYREAMKIASSVQRRREKNSNL